MDYLSFSLAWSPVLLLTVLAVFFRMPALKLSIWGTIFTLGLVVWYYGTPWSVALAAGLDGMLTTLPLILVIIAGILLSTLLMGTGSLKRLVDWFMGGVAGPYQQSLLIAMGVGNFMEGAGVIAEPVVAPMLAAAGVTPAGAAALSIVGYAGLMTLEMAGIIITVLALVTGYSAYELGVASAWLSLPATLAMALLAVYYLPRLGGLGRRVGLALLAGLVAGLAALAAALWLSDSIGGMLGGLAVMVVLVLLGTRRLPLTSEILVELAPFAFLLSVLLGLNMIGPLHELFAKQLVLKVAVIPVHQITFRPLYSGYLYLFLALFLAAFLQNVSGHRLKETLAVGLSKAWRAAVAMALFGAMGQMVSYSGYSAGFGELVQTSNLPWVLAQGLAASTGGFYPIFVPVLGWVGTFLTGYGVASLMLFGALMVSAAGVLGISGVWLAAGLAVGCSLGSISSPFKIAIATPMSQAVGQEGDILRLTIPVGIGASLLVGVVLWLAVGAA
ncbi:MAG: L-lactate permease [Deltaproteobacteria bacterium]|nr:L-lactate permease [Deltaproteobacteria bacterium]